MKKYSLALVITLFMSQLMAQNIPSYVPKDGLVGWWPFNGNANDESGNGNHGTVNGATLTLDRNGYENKAYNFDGLSNYIVVKNIQTNLKSFTLSGWVASKSFKGSAYFQVGEDSGHGECGGLAIGQGSGDFGSAGNELIGINSCKNWIGTNIKIPELQKWNHIVLVKDSLDLKYYFNGELVYSNQISEPNQMPSTIFFGTRYFDANCAFDGKLDDIAYFNRSLNYNEIKSLYNSTESASLPSYLPKDGLVGWWPFNGNANDESGNGNHGTVNGAILTTDRNGNSEKAYRFDGKNFTHIAVKNNPDNSLNLINDLSITCWINSDSMYNNQSTVRSILMKSGDGVGAPNSYTFGIWGGIDGTDANVGMVNFGGPSKNNISSYPWDAGFIKISNWYNLTVVYSRNLKELHYFINGKLVKKIQIDLTFENNDNPLWIGSQPSIFSTIKTFYGKIDDIAIYNRALTEAEVQALYTGTPLCTTPPTPKVNPTVTTCAGNSISFEATGATGIETYNWYDVAEGGTPIATSQIIKTPVLNYGENKTYWVSITNGVCESTRARIDVIVKELPTVKKPENYSVCAGEFIQSLNFAVTPQGATNYWSNDNTAIGLPSSGMGTIQGFVSQNSTEAPLLSNITVTPSFNGCIGKSETFKIYVIPTPKLIITNLKPIVYTSDAPFVLVGEPAGGNFIGEAIVGNNFTPAKATLGKKSIEYKYISKDGCGGAEIASTIVVDTNGVICTKYDTIKVKETIYDTVLKITFKLTTGINISKTTSLSVYPNPTADNLIIDAADVAAMSGYSYQLLDAVGKEIYSQMVTSKKTEISLKTLGAKGVYVLNVLDANNQSVVSKKIVLE